MFKIYETKINENTIKNEIKILKEKKMNAINKKMVNNLSEDKVKVENEDKFD